MAKHYYGINIGGGLDPSAVSTGTSTTNKDVEVVITDSVSGMSKAEVMKLLETLESKIMEGNAPA